MLESCCCSFSLPSSYSLIDFSLMYPVTWIIDRLSTPAALRFFTTFFFALWLVNLFFSQVRIQTRLLQHVIELLSFVFFPFLVLLSFCCPCLPDIQPGLGSFHRVFLFRIFLKFLDDLLAWQSKPTVRHF